MRQIDQKESGYLALFDLIARHQEYDERKLKKKLSSLGHDFNFAYAKNYLTKHILRVLREARAANSVDRLLTEIQILMDRKVFGLAEKMLVKAKETAWKEERWTLYLELSSVEIALMLQRGGDMDGGIREIQAINQQRTEARRKLMVLGEYEDLYALYRPVVKRKQVARNDWDLGLIRELRDHPLLSDTSNADSARAYHVYLQCMVMVHLYLGEYEQAMEKIALRLSHADDHSFLIEDTPADYLNDQLRLGGMLLHFRRFDAVSNVLDRIRQFQASSGLHGVEMFDKYYRLLIGLAIEAGDANMVLPAYEQILSGLETYRDSMPLASRMTFMSLLARLQFEQGNLTEARLLLEGILAEAESGVREDILCMSRIMLVCIYVDKGDSDLAESASKAVRKFLHRREQLFAFERRILKFLERTGDVLGSTRELNALEELKQDLDGIFQDPREASVLSLFDVQAWLRAKIAELQA